MRLNELSTRERRDFFEALTLIFALVAIALLTGFGARP